MEQKSRLALFSFPPDVLAIITSYLNWDDLQPLLESSNAVMRHKMCVQGGVRHLLLGNVNAPRYASLWPTNRAFPYARRWNGAKKPCPFYNLDTLTILELFDSLKLDLFPPTITSLDLQSTYVTERIMPYFATNASGPPLLLAKLFPSLLHLSVLSLPRPRVLGIVMMVIPRSDSQDFFRNLPQTLTSLQYDAYDFPTTWSNVQLLPPNLTHLGCGGSHWKALPVFDTTDIQYHGFFNQLTSLLLWHVAAHEELLPLLKHVPNSQHLAFTSISSRSIAELPKGLTRLGLSIPYNPSEQGNPTWPVSLTTFDFAYLAESFFHYHLPPQALHFRVAQGHHDVNYYLTTQWFAGIQDYTNLITVAIPQLPAHDDVILMLPTSVKTINFDFLILRGHLYVPENVPSTWTPTAIRQAAQLFLAHWDKCLLLNSPSKTEVATTPSVIPEGVLQVDGLTLLYDSSRLKLPSTLTTLPSSYLVQDENVETLPRDLQQIESPAVTICPNSALHLPTHLPHLTRINSIHWYLSHFDDWLSLFHDTFSSDVKVLTFPDDIAPLLERKYLPNIVLSKPSTFTSSFEVGRTLNVLPPHITSLKLTGRQIWYKMRRHDFPPSLTMLEVEHYFCFPTHAPLSSPPPPTRPHPSHPSSSSSPTFSNMISHSKPKQGRSKPKLSPYEVAPPPPDPADPLTLDLGTNVLPPLPSIHEVLSELVYVTNVTLSGRAASSFLFEIPPNPPRCSLSHLEFLTLNVSPNDFSTAYHLSVLTPNLRKLRIVGALNTSDKMLATLVPHSLTSLEIDTSALTLDSSSYLPPSLTELILHTHGKVTGPQILARIRAKP